MPPNSAMVEATSDAIAASSRTSAQTATERHPTSRSSAATASASAAERE